MNVLILESDKSTYDQLCEMMVQHDNNCIFLGMMTTVQEGRDFFLRNKERVDIIIADTQLSDGLAFYALDDAPEDVPVVFVSATEEYAMKAFEYNSLSYILKPLNEERLYEAIRKTQERLITNEHRKELMQMVKKHAKYRERFFVKTFKSEKIIHISQVRYMVSENKTTYLVLKDGTSYEFDMTLSALAETLNPKLYMRVNRKYIVPEREVERFEHGINGKEFLVLSGDNPPEIIL
ncbi:MAG: response regulator transcription factor, partial [Prevotella sp.]|nr:response regulator transcription factor [Candidatus Prevotella equi]